MTFLIERGVLKQYTGTDAIVQIPEGVTEIGYRAFYENKAMTQVVLPDSLVKIGIQAFAGCTALEQIAFSPNLRIIGHEAFQDTAWYLEMPDGIVYAGPLAWKIKGELRHIAEVSIPAGIVKLCADLFRNCTALVQVQLPDTLVELDDRVFQNCRKLKQIQIPSNVAKIGDRAFDECMGLSVQLDSMDVSIGRQCFPSGTKLHVRHVHPAKIPVNVRDSAIISFADDVCENVVLDPAFLQAMYQYIQNRRKQYYPLAIKHWNLMHTMIQAQMISLEEVEDLLDAILHDGQADHAATLMRYKQQLTDVEELDFGLDTWEDLTLDWDIPLSEKTVTQLEQEWGIKKNSDDTYTLMRYYGTDLDITIPSNIGDKVISAIGPYALSPVRYGIKHERAAHLETIRSVVVQDGITRIGNNAFDGCKALVSVTLPQSIERIEKDAFADCTWKL